MDELDQLLPSLPREKHGEIRAWWNANKGEFTPAELTARLREKYPSIPGASSDATATAGPQVNVPPRMTALAEQVSPAQQMGSATLARTGSLPQRPTAAGALSRGYAQGATFGGGDEMVDFFGGDEEITRLQNARAQEDYPIRYGAGQAMGGITSALTGQAGLAALATRLGLPTAASWIAPTAAKGFLGNIVQGSAEGLVQGGVTGALTAPPGERMEGMVAGGIPGMLFGTGGALLGEGFSAGASLFSSRPARSLLGLARADDADLTAVGSELLRNPNFRAVDQLGPRARGSAEALAQVPGPAREILEGLPRRAMERGGRVLAAAEREAGSPGNAFEHADALRQARSTEAAPLYRDAMFKPDGTVRRVQAAEIGQLLRDSPLAQRAWRVARQIAQEDKANGVLPANFVMPEVFPSGIANYPVPVLHYLKMGLDEVNSSATSGLGAISRGQAKTVQARILEALEGRVPQYRTAREAYRGSSEAMEAFELGRNALRMDPGEVEYLTKSMSSPELEQFRLGMVSGIEREVVSGSPASAASKLGIGPGGRIGRRGLLETFTDPAGQSRMTQMLADEDKMIQSERIFGNSPTAPREASMREEFRGGQSFTGAVARRLRRSLIGPEAVESQTDRARVLMMGGQEAQTVIPEALSLQGRQTALRDLGTRLGTGGALTAGQQNAPEDVIAQANAYYLQLLEAGVTPERALDLASTRFGLK